MMRLKDWDDLLGAMRMMVTSGRIKARVNHYKLIVKFLEDKVPRINELDTHLAFKERKDAYK